jgi:hypothetical protein
MAGTKRSNMTGLAQIHTKTTEKGWPAASRSMAVFPVSQQHDEKPGISPLESGFWDLDAGGHIGPAPLPAERLLPARWGVKKF